MTDAPNSPNPNSPDPNPGWLSDDDLLLAELGRAVGEAEVPRSFVRAGKAAFAWRTVDAELADLRFDSWLAPAELSGMRAEQPGSWPRELSFGAGELSIELELRPDAVRGQLLPGQPGTFLVRDADGPVLEGSADDEGWFVIAPVPPGRFRLQVRTPAGATAITDWIDPIR